MNSVEYLEKSIMFRAPQGEIPLSIAWGLGLVTETIELTEKWSHRNASGPTDVFMDEAGDCLWYLAQLCHDSHADFVAFMSGDQPQLDLPDDMLQQELLASAKAVGEWIKKNYFHSPRDTEHLRTALLRYSYYWRHAVAPYGPDTVASMNIKKLSARHGGQFKGEYKS